MTIGTRQNESIQPRILAWFPNEPLVLHATVTPQFRVAEPIGFKISSISRTAYQTDQLLEQNNSLLQTVNVIREL
jgi:hypothetical protein